jgi:hypothetical protein
MDTTTRPRRGMIRIQPRSWITAGVAIAAVASSCVVRPAGVADADVCASVGRRVSVSGCTNVADTVNGYVGVGRRIHVSGCN